MNTSTTLPPPHYSSVAAAQAQNNSNSSRSVAQRARTNTGFTVCSSLTNAAKTALFPVKSCIGGFREDSLFMATYSDVAVRTIENPARIGFAFGGACLGLPLSCIGALTGFLSGILVDTIQTILPGPKCLDVNTTPPDHCFFCLPETYTTPYLTELGAQGGVAAGGVVGLGAAGGCGAIICLASAPCIVETPECVGALQTCIGSEQQPIVDA